MFLTKEQIVAVDDLATEEVEIWGGKLLVRGLTAEERETLRKETGEDGKQEIPNLIPRLVAMTVVDPETKKPMFTEKDIAVFQKKSAQSLDKLFLVASKLSGMGAEGEKAVEKK